MNECLIISYDISYTDYTTLEPLFKHYNEDVRTLTGIYN